MYGDGGQNYWRTLTKKAQEGALATGLLAMFYSLTWVVMTRMPLHIKINQAVHFREARFTVYKLWELRAEYPKVRYDDVENTWN